MKPSLQAGLSYHRSVTIDHDRTISFMGEDARVYGTPWMILDMERTCRDLIMQHAEPGEDSVGIGVSVRHLAAALPNMTVEIDVRIMAVEGRKVTFEVTARDAIEAIGAGTHTRFIVDTAKTAERLKAKMARRDSALA